MCFETSSFTYPYLFHVWNSIFKYSCYLGRNDYNSEQHFVITLLMSSSLNLHFVEIILAKDLIINIDSYILFVFQYPYIVAIELENIAITINRLINTVI